MPKLNSLPVPTNILVQFEMIELIKGFLLVFPAHVYSSSLRNFQHSVVVWENRTTTQGRKRGQSHIPAGNMRVGRKADRTEGISTRRRRRCCAAFNTSWRSGFLIVQQEKVTKVVTLKRGSAWRSSTTNQREQSRTTRSSPAP